MKKTESKQDKLIKMLRNESEFFTVEEMINTTGLSKGSINNYVKYYLKKLGYDIILGDKNGMLSYRITKK